MKTNDVQHFWSPPDGEQILSMAKFQDVIVVATTGGVYVITDYGKSLPDWIVQKLSNYR